MWETDLCVMSKKAYFLMDVLIIVNGVSLLLSMVLYSYQSQIHYEEGLKNYQRRNHEYWMDVYQRIEECAKEAC